MRVQTEEWRRFIPGVRMYKGKMTLFYNGELLMEGYYYHHGRPLVYDKEERQKWEVIIVLPGVEIIPEGTFDDCKNVETVIMADTVRRIESLAFNHCKSLVYVKLSKNLEYLGNYAFYYCTSMKSIFIPESCRKIGNHAVFGCKKLIVFSVPQHTSIGNWIIGDGTALCRCRNRIEMDAIRYYRTENRVDTALLRRSRERIDNKYHEKINSWIKSLNQESEFELHRECASCDPSVDVLYGMILKKQGSLSSFHVKNKIGITAYQYLQMNPFFEMEEQKLINRFVLDLMGETISY